MKTFKYLYSFIAIALLSCSFTVLADKSENAHVLYRPTFETSEGVATAGTAFVISHQNHYFAVSAQHLIGTAGGLDRDYHGNDMGEVFKKVELEPINADGQNLKSSLFVPIENAAPISEETAKYDVFISPLKKTDSEPFTLAKELPQIGETVFLYASVVGSEELMHPATLMAHSSDHLIYVFENKNINLRATSGAPVMNEHNEVIGINLAGGAMDDGRVIGFANPYASISLFLEKNHKK